MKKKEYTRDQLTVIWQPDLCIHSGVCVHALPDVFRPRDRPWIQLEAGEIKAIEDTVNACPSGAISLKTVQAPAPESDPGAVQMTQVKVFANGPVRVLGPCAITLADGTVVEKLNGISFCRCGRSANKPFCDSSHKTNGFTD